MSDLDGFTDDELAAELATRRHMSLNLVRTRLGMSVIPPVPACSCELRLRNWNGGHGTTVTIRNLNCTQHGDDHA